MSTESFPPNFEFKSKTSKLTDFIITDKLNHIDKDRLVHSITHFIGGFDFDTILRLKGKTSYDDSRPSLKQKIKTIEDVEMIIKAFDEGMISTTAPFYEELARRLPLMRSYVSRIKKVVDFDSYYIQQNMEAEKARKLLEQDSSFE